MKEMSQSHAEEIRRIYAKVSDLNSDITITILEKDHWKREAQKWKRQIDQHQTLASGNLRKEVSRGDLPPDIIRQCQEENEGQNSNETCSTHAVLQGIKEEDIEGVVV